MAKDLDAQVADFRDRPLDAALTPSWAAEALMLNIRAGGRVIGVHALVAVGPTPTVTGRSSAYRSFCANDGAG